MVPCRYEERQKARAEEIKGCSEALAILSSVPGLLSSSLGDHGVRAHCIEMLAFDFGLTILELLSNYFGFSGITVAGLFSVYHLALYGCNALPRQDDAHDTFTRTFNFVQVTVKRMTLLNARREGPEVCIAGETFRPARVVGWVHSSRHSRC